MSEVLLKIADLFQELANEVRGQAALPKEERSTEVIDRITDELESLAWSGDEEFPDDDIDHTVIPGSEYP